MSKPATPEKIEAARDALRDCLRGIEISVNHLKRNSLSVQYESTIALPDYIQGLRNDIMQVALSLQRLEDISRRLLSRLGHDIGRLNKSLSASIPIRVINRLANSWKHGLGGQQKNATLLNGVISVQRADGYPDDSGRRRVMVIGMTVVDAKDGAFGTNTLFHSATRDWATLLQPAASEVVEWAKKVFPDPQGTVVKAPDGAPGVFPLGSTIVFEFPEDFQSMLKADANERGESA